ncbi:MAG: DUF1571 domain-containing protein [Bacteroidota bacterium]
MFIQYNISIAIFFVLFNLTAFPQNIGKPEGEGITSRAVIEKMLLSIDHIKTLKFKLKQFERINGQMIAGEKDIKISLSPLKIYIYLHSPDQGAEILWREAENDGDALVNPNSFPYFNLNLDPYGKILRKDQHHTTFKVGFDYLAQIIRAAINKYEEDAYKYCKYLGTEIWNNTACYKIVLDYDDFKYIPYIVKKDETLNSIAEKLKVSEYMIMEINADVDDYDDVSPGQQIMVPNVYAKKTILYIDKKNNLPIVQQIYDEKGLYEKYEFHNLQINPVIPEEEFTESYKGYNF